MEEENKIVGERREKLAGLRRAGVAYPNDFTRTHLSFELEAAHGAKSKDELEAQPVQATIAGRLMLKRVMGKASFGVLQDHAGRLQIYVSDDRTGKEGHALFKHLDLGDIVFTLVDLGLLISLPTDTRDDFVDVFQFEEAFEQDYPWGRNI
jgi:lysyl-tRNA synthetase class 2